MSYEYKKAVISELVSTIKDEGFRVFVADSGTYGFFTDVEGSRVVCFQVNYLSPVFSGNYKTSNPRGTGTGWGITDENDTFPESFRKLFDAVPPRWAVGDASWRYTTLEEHLEMYQKSSKYEEA